MLGFYFRPLGACGKTEALKRSEYTFRSPGFHNLGEAAGDPRSLEGMVLAAVATHE